MYNLYCDLWNIKSRKSALHYWGGGRSVASEWGSILALNNLNPLERFIDNVKMTSWCHLIKMCQNESFPSPYEALSNCYVFSLCFVKATWGFGCVGGIRAGGHGFSKKIEAVYFGQK